MKQPLFHILSLTILLLLPFSESFVYGQVYIQRSISGQTQNCYIGHGTRQDSGTSFTTVAEAASYIGTLYYYQSEWISVEGGITDNDVIVLTGDTSEEGPITISNQNITIKSNDDATGRTITATNGTYDNNCLLYINEGSVTIDASITLDAKNINNQISVVRLDDSNSSLTLYGTLTGGNTTGDSSSGGGITVKDGNATIHGTIEQCQAVKGGGIYYKGGKAIISSTGAIKNCEATKDGAGVYIDKWKELELYGNVQNCKAENNGGGIFGAENSKITIEGATVESNEAKIGGGVYAMTSGEGFFNFTSGTIQNNTASDCGGGIYINLCSNNTIGENATIMNNTAVNDGGGIYINEWSKLTVKGKIQGNEATNGNGGGIYVCNKHAGLTIENAIIGGENDGQGNKAPEGKGGGIYCDENTDDHKFTFTSGTVAYNSAKNGGGIYLNHSYHNTFGAAKIENNTATDDGGGLFINEWVPVVFDNPNASVSYNQSGKKGGGIYSNHSNLIIKNCSISDNHCEGTSNSDELAGGGIYVYETRTDSEGSIFNMEGGIVAGNYLTTNADNNFTSANLRGAGICLDISAVKSASISGGTISENKMLNLTPKHGELYQNFYGGGIYVKNTVGDGNATLTISGGTISQNEAVKGGGITVSANTQLIMNNSNSNINLNENKAQDIGGAIWTEGVENGNLVPTIDLTNVTFSKNTSGNDGGAIDVHAVTSNSQINGCTFTENKALNGFGGAINVETFFNAPLSFELVGSVFNGNTSTDADVYKGSAISIDREVGGEKVRDEGVLHTVVLSGTNSFATGQSVHLDNKAVLTKGTSMAFTGNVPLDVYPEDLFDGRDILVSQSGTSASAAVRRGLDAPTQSIEGAEVTKDDLAKLNIVAPNYHKVFNNEESVIELLKNYLLTISCTGLQANESAAYRVKDASNDGGQVLYNVILTGNDTGNPVSKTIEMDYEPAMPLTVGSTWEWTYSANTSNPQVVSFDTETKEVTCSFTVTKKTEKLNPHGEHSITLGNTTTNE